ncbi:MAG TPA: amidohydrolase family protein [Methylomirabilota bacterium]|nr:amidohydrolase family protein [Methylomirabilota bacterium]
MSQVLFRNAQLLDPTRADLADGTSVLVEGDRIREVSSRPIKAPGAAVIDCGGRTLMPGLIDCHVHVFLSEVNLRYLESVPLTLMTARAAGLMRAMLDRGFTTVRDTGGADWGIREGVALGHLPGPRLFVAGRAIGQTSGHSDARRRTDPGAACHTCNAMAFTLAIADGADEVRRAAREQLRQGADHVKIMVSGGVASPYDPLESLQYTVDEIRAAVEEARTFKKYVCAHAYPAEAVARAVEHGVRVIEHGNLIDAPTARLMAKHGAFLVPTLVAYDGISRHGARFGMGAESLEKNTVVLEAGLRSLELCREAGVRMAYGSDLLGQLQPDQSREFLLRAEVLSPREVLHSATVVGAELLGRAGELGVVAPGALADLLVVDGNPLQDLKLFQDQGAHLAVIMQGGRLHKNSLTAA